MKHWDKNFFRESKTPSVKYLFKFKKEDIKKMSMDNVLASLMLTLNLYFPIRIR